MLPNSIINQESTYQEVGPRGRSKFRQSQMLDSNIHKWLTQLEMYHMTIGDLRPRDIISFEM